MTRKQQTVEVIDVVTIAPHLSEAGLEGYLVTDADGGFILLKGEALTALESSAKRPKRRERRERRSSSNEKKPSAQCTICNKAMAQSGNVYAHVRRVHEKTGDVSKYVKKL